MERGGLSQDQTQIACIQFGFDNSRLLQMLEQRANALKNANFKKATQIEEKMTQYKN